MGEPFHGHGIAIPDGRFHGLGKGDETGHAVLSKSIFRKSLPRT
jgi:hypothetical protein